MRQTRLGRLYQDGDIIFHKGDQGDCMFLVQKGTLDVILEEDKGKVVNTIHSGEFFGEMAMFEKCHERSAGAIAVEPSQVLILSEEILKRFIEKKAPRRFLSNTIGVLCHRLRLTNSMYMRSRYGDEMAHEVEHVNRA